MVGEQATSDLHELKRISLKGWCCIQCESSQVDVEQIVFQGIHIMAKCICTRCGEIFFQTLPIGHDFLFPISFDAVGKKIKADAKAMVWLVRPLIDSIVHNDQVNVAIEKEVREQKQDAIILNCLDNCFGHSFSKLWNASILKAKYPDKSIIVFIPKVMRWLVPAGISEVWSFDASFINLEKYIVNLDVEVKQNLLPRFNSVWLSKAYTHLDLAKVDLKAMLKTNRFDLDKFSNSTPRITFILREDRFWHRCSFEFFLFKVFVKLNLSKKIFVWRQNHLVNKVANHVRKEFDSVSFVAAGLNRTGRLSPLIDDRRKTMLTAENEIEWCNLYAGTHVVIGVHGSNMIIPTALSAGFIEILPRYKIRHMAEETLIDYNSRYSLFLGRHLDHFASPNLVARHAVSMIRDFPYLYKNTEQEI